MSKAYALIEGEYIYAVVFDYDLAHEIASEYDFDIEEVDEFSDVNGSTH